MGASPRGWVLALRAGGLGPVPLLCPSWLLCLEPERDLGPAWGWESPWRVWQGGGEGFTPVFFEIGFGLCGIPWAAFLERQHPSRAVGSWAEAPLQSGSICCGTGDVPKPRSSTSSPPAPLRSCSPPGDVEMGSSGACCWAPSHAQAAAPGAGPIAGCSGWLCPVLKRVPEQFLALKLPVFWNRVTCPG